MIFDLIVIALIGGLIWALVNHKITISALEDDYDKMVGWFDARIAKLESKDK